SWASVLPVARSMMGTTSQTEELSTSCLPTTDLSQPLADLQTQIVALHHQLAELTSQLQKERERREAQELVPQDVLPLKPSEPPSPAKTSAVPTASSELATDLPLPDVDLPKLSPRRDRRRRAAHILPV